MFPFPARASTQGELHRDFDDHVDSLSQSRRRRESPLFYGRYGALIQSGAPSAEHRHVANGAVPLYDDFELDIAGDPPAACLLGGTLALTSCSNRGGWMPLPGRNGPPPVPPPEPSPTPVPRPSP